MVGTWVRSEYDLVSEKVCWPEDARKFNKFLMHGCCIIWRERNLFKCSNQMFQMFIQKARSSVVSDLRSETRFPIWVWSLALYRVELSAVAQAALGKLFVCRHPNLGFAGRVGRDFFLFWWKSVLFPGPYHRLI